MKNPEYFEILKSDIFRAFIREHYITSPSEVILRGDFPEDWPRELVADQLNAAAKLLKKFPQYSFDEDFIMPPALSVEQATGKRLSSYKARILGEVHHTDSRFADLTTGMGIDAMTWAEIFHEGVSCEMNPLLAKISAHNAAQRHPNLSVESNDAESFLKEPHRPFDFIYLDPARRNASGNRVFSHEDCTPNPVTLLPLIWQKTSSLWIKLSPMLDITELKRIFPELSTLHVLAVQQECKELLLHLVKDFKGNLSIRTHHLLADGSVSVFDRTGTVPAQPKTAVHPHKFLYYPNVAVRKAALLPELGESFGLEKLTASSSWLTSEYLHRDFPGKVFEYSDLVPYSRKSVSELCEDPGVVISAGFPQDAEALRRLFQISEGDEIYYLFYLKENKKFFIKMKHIRFS